MRNFSKILVEEKDGLINVIDFYNKFIKKSFGIKIRDSRDAEKSEVEYRDPVIGQKLGLKSWI